MNSGTYFSPCQAPAIVSFGLFVLKLPFYRQTLAERESRSRSNPDFNIQINLTWNRYHADCLDTDQTWSTNVKHNHHECLSFFPHFNLRTLYGISMQLSHLTLSIHLSPCVNLFSHTVWHALLTMYLNFSLAIHLSLSCSSSLSFSLSLRCITAIYCLVFHKQRRDNNYICTCLPKLYLDEINK